MFTTVLIALLVIVHPVACQIALDSDLYGNDPDLDFQQNHLNPMRVHFTTFPLQSYSAITPRAY